jgi:hypothetical protein
MDRLFLIVMRLLSNPSVIDGVSVVAEPARGIAGTGRRALPLTAVLEFLLAGSRVGRWPRRPERAQARRWAGICSDQERKKRDREDERPLHR